MREAVKTPRPMQNLERITSIDAVRGLAMIVMALDHVRDYLGVHVPGTDPTDPSTSSLLLFFTRWITYVAAPTFVFLAGTSVWLRAESRRGDGLAGFLATRGLWLILLELTIVGTGFTFKPGYLFLQVIWVIGASMMLLAPLTRLPSTAVLAIGLSIVVGHDLIPAPSTIQPSLAQLPLALINGRIALLSFGPAQGVLLYSLAGWLGIMLVGYGAGPLFAMERLRRNRLLIRLAGAALVLFAILRAYNHFGDPLPWSSQPTAARQAMSWLRVSKYPPSLDYTLVMLGLMLLALAAFERLGGAAARVLRTLGRVPLLFYVLHIYLIHGLAAATGVAQGLPFKAFTDPMNPPGDFGLPLWGVYAVWIGVVATLYPACAWFSRLRQRRSDWWLSYL